MRAQLKFFALSTASLFAVLTVAQAQSSDLSGLTLVPGASLGLSLSTPPLVFDNVTGNAANLTSTASTPNTFMGGGYNLAPGTTSITGFDVYPVNLSGVNYTGLQINIFVWGTVNMGAVSAATPAFGSLLGSYTLTASGSFDNGFYFPFESATPGATPGITLASPLAISSTTIGLTFNFQGTTDGVNYANANSLTSVIATGNPATVGSEVFNGYYRNANSEVNGNFTSALRSLGLQNQSLAVRIYTEVPEPTSVCLSGLGVGAWMVSRLRTRRPA